MERKMFLAATVVVIIFAALYISGSTETGIEPFEPFEPPKNETVVDDKKDDEELEEELEGLFENVSLETVEIWGGSAIKVPAVDDEGKGVVTWLTVDIMPGKGRTLTDINQLLFWVDTQYSIQVAKAVAANYTKMNLTNLDILYAIDTDAALVEGTSAGAALTVATVAALRNETLDEDVMITGTIEADGSIGPVGGIIEKATAAKDVGITTFLVPPGQSMQTSYRQERECKKVGPVTYCTTNYVPESTDIEAEVDIDVEEVSSIGEALKYFIE